jgi:HAD superfamily hydrolase (TIGR01509 family)
LIIFDCNGVLVDSEPIAMSVLASALNRLGISLPPEVMARSFQGRRPSDMFAAIERYAKKRLPPDFASTVAAETLRRLQLELRPVPHAAHALTWIRGPKAVASSSPMHRVKASLEATGLIRFVEGRLFSASDVLRGKPAADLFLLAASRLRVSPAECVVVEDSVAGVLAATAAGMKSIGFVGRHPAEGHLADDLLAAGACGAIADMRDLKAAIAAVRGW